MLRAALPPGTDSARRRSLLRPDPGVEAMMVDLFPTTDEAEKEELQEQAAAAHGIVNHPSPEAYGPDPARPGFDCRPLGVAALTGGRVDAHVLRAVPGQTAAPAPEDAPPDFQLVFVLKGWAILEYEGYGSHRLVAGSSAYRPPGVRRRELDRSDDFEMLEITIPTTAGWRAGAGP